jgi:hypothetical protein
MDQSLVLVSKKSEHNKPKIILPDKNARPKRPKYRLSKDLPNNGIMPDLNIPQISTSKLITPKPVTSRSPSAKSNRSKNSNSSKEKAFANPTSKMEPDIAHSFLIDQKLSKPAESPKKHDSKFTFSLKKLDSIKNKYGSNANSPINRRKMSTNS